MALVLYDPNPLPFLQVFKTEKRNFTLGNELQSITISQDWNNYGVAAVVWEAALILGTYLLSIKDNLKGKKVIELGSGTGFCGIVAGLLDAHVTFTDLENCLHACQTNVDANLVPSKHTFLVQDLDWKEDLNKRWSNVVYDFIIGADLVYIEETFQDLVKTFKHFAELNENIIIILSGKIRYQERFDKFKTILEHDFKIEYLQYNVDTKTYILKLFIR